ncbi:putative integral membrane protein [Acanthocheilonema viteae]
MHDGSTVTDSKPQQVWSFCPLTRLQLSVIISLLLAYSLIYLIYAQHHAILFYMMTGLVAALMASLYTSGLLAVVYMLIMISKFDKELEYCTTTKIAITDIKIYV